MPKGRKSGVYGRRLDTAVPVERHAPFVAEGDELLQGFKQLILDGAACTISGAIHELVAGATCSSHPTGNTGVKRYPQEALNNGLSIPRARLLLNPRLSVRLPVKSRSADCR